MGQGRRHARSSSRRASWWTGSNGGREVLSRPSAPALRGAPASASVAIEHIL
ncbi:Uncharacterised protein [Amycolatopsis camponoti]|uniref:Uncharacterized protein n=1 Tax=Amycolatopsis camponoti TaxID=2606593 RepID=A0A6I8M0P8_9PSEU|nr:Uncharacterised protein [Amycolatopsis camponoti]